MASTSVNEPQDDVSNGQKIGNMVQHQYRDLIIKHVRVGPIMGRMSIPDEYQETVSTINASESSEDFMAATRQFLAYLASHQDPRDYLLFVQLLEEEGYDYISKLLRGDATEDPKTHQEQRKLLEFFSKAIEEKVDFDKIYTKLIEDSWLDEEDRERLKCQANYKGNTAALRWMLSYILPKRKENWMKQFLQILRDLGYDDLAEWISGDTDDANASGIDVDMESSFTDDDTSNIGTNIVHASGSAYIPMNNLDEPGLPYVSEKRKFYESSEKMKRTRAWTEENILPMPQCFSDTSSIAPSEEDNSKVDFEAEVAVTPKLIAVREETIIDLESRPYQEELARSATAGQNVIIIAPTGSGKTVVAIRIMQKHIEKKRQRNGKGKIAFFANEVNLVDQQHKMCKNQVPSTIRTTLIVGETKDKSKIPAQDLIKQNDIIFMTPQIIVDCLSNKHLELSVFSLLVFDECHNVNSKHPSNMIMAAYMDMKFNENSGLPQIVGLTASVGTGRKKAGTKLEGAVDHIKGLCARLDARGGLVTVRENRESLAEYTNLVETAIKRTKERLVDPLKTCIINIMEQIEDKICEKQDYLELKDDEDIKSSMDKNTMAYKQWLSKMRGQVLPRVQDDEIRKPLLTYIEHLTVYNRALVINEDCRGQDALQCITEFMDSGLRSSEGEEGWLCNLFSENKTELEHESMDEINMNPKLMLLQLEIVEKIRKDPRSKILVLVGTRDLAQALLRWMKETGGLKNMNPVIVTGCGAASDKGGMTRAEQKKAVKSFKFGPSHVAIATSVAEEGMDFAQCNRVIRYEYVSNEIGTVQARGRASRADEGDYCLITGSAEAENREQNNLLLEKVMDEAVEVIHAEVERSPEAFVVYMEDLQKKGKTNRDVEKKQQHLKILSKDPNAHSLHCFKCGTRICLSTDLRVLNKCHYMVLTPDIGTLVFEVAHKKPVEFDGIRKCSKIHCKDCRADWGVACLYRDTKFAMLSPKGLLFKDPQGKQYYRKQWKGVPFACKTFTDDDQLNYKASFEETLQVQA